MARPGMLESASITATVWQICQTLVAATSFGLLVHQSSDDADGADDETPTLPRTGTFFLRHPDRRSRLQDDRSVLRTMRTVRTIDSWRWAARPVSPQAPPFSW